MLSFLGLLGFFLLALGFPYVSLSLRGRAWFALKCTAGLVYAHEVTWYVLARVYYPPVSDNLGVGNIVALSLMVWILHRKGKIDWRVVKYGAPAMLAYFALWVLSGYHVTIVANFTVAYHTALYHDLATNLTEIGSWWTTCASFGAAILYVRFLARSASKESAPSMNPRIRTRAKTFAMLAFLVAASLVFMPLSPAHANAPIPTSCAESFTNTSSSLSSYSFTISAGTVYAGTCDNSTWAPIHEVFVSVTTYSTLAGVTGITDSGGNTFTKSASAVNAVPASVSQTAAVIGCVDGTTLAESQWYATVLTASTTFTVNLANAAPKFTGQGWYIHVDVLIVFTDQSLIPTSASQGLTATLTETRHYPNTNGFKFNDTATTAKISTVPNTVVVFSSATNTGSCIGSGGTPPSVGVPPLAVVHDAGQGYFFGSANPQAALTGGWGATVHSSFTFNCNTDESESAFDLLFDENDQCYATEPFTAVVGFYTPSGVIMSTSNNSTIFGNNNDITTAGRGIKLAANQTYLYIGTTSVTGGTISQLESHVANVTLSGTSDPKVRITMGVFETATRTCDSNNVCSFIGNLDPVTNSNPYLLINSCTTQLGNHASNQILQCTPNAGLLNNTEFAIGIVVQHTGVFLDSSTFVQTPFNDSVDTPNSGVGFFFPPDITQFVPATSVIFLGSELFVPEIHTTQTLTQTTTTTTTTTTCASGANCSSITVTNVVNTTSTVVHDVNSPNMSALNAWLLPMVFVFAPYFLVLITVLRFNGSEEKAFENALTVSTITSWAAFGFDRASPTFMPVYLPVALTFIAFLYFWRGRD